MNSLSTITLVLQQKRFLCGNCSKHKRLSGLTATLLAATVTIAQAQIMYVTPDGTGAGANWSNATSLTNALVSAQDTDQIWLAQGSYTNGATFTVPANRALYGGFTNGMATFAERDWEAYPALLDGLAANRRVVTVSGADVILDGLVITNASGAAAGGITKTSGGGTLTLANCRIVNHNGTAGSMLGLGGYFTSGTVLMTNTLVSGNTVGLSSDNHSSRGFGIWSSASMEIVDCVFSNNYGPAYNARHALGVGLYFGGTALTVRDTVFVDNRGSSHVNSGGSAVYLANASGMQAVFSNCLFRANQCLTAGGLSAGQGAAIYAVMNNNATSRFVNCTIAYSTNHLGSGGAIYLTSGTLELKNTLLWGNTVLGGGQTGHDIYVHGGTLRADYCGFQGVASPYVHVAGGSATLSNCMDDDPLFASATDVHVSSPAGRWEDGSWVTTDTVYSPAIDAGDPADPVGAEPSQNGGRINLGYYAGTAQASKSPDPVAPKVANRDPVVNDYTRMILKGELTNDAPVIATVGICYGTTEIATETTNGWDTVYMFYPPQQTGTVFSVMTSYLVTNTTYYYRTFASNTTGTSWAPVASFSTSEEYPPLWDVGGGPNVIHVRAGAIGEADGRDWYNAYTTIGAGITAISGSRTNIWITGGTYSQGLVLTLNAAAAVYGGFAAGETAVSQRATNALGVVTNYTVMNGGNAHGCLNVTATGTVLLDAMVFSNANTRAVSKTGTGTLIARNCRFVKNTSSSVTGVGAYLNGGTVWLENCRIENNSGSENGVGVHFNNSTVTMTNCLVAGNIHGALGDAHSKLGIGIYADGGCNLHIVDCVIRDQQGAGYTSRHGRGGGLAFDNGTLRVTGTEFTGNRKTGHTYGGGAAVFLGNSTTMSAVFSNCIFRANEVTQGQAGLDGSRGGAVQAELNIARSASFVNCTFAHNTNSISTPLGGAIYLHSGTLNLRNCILWTNRVTGTGGTGHELYVADGATMNVTHSMLTGTTSPHIAGTAAFTSCLTGDPLLASATDFHLQSAAGRWDPSSGNFVETDTEYSRAIDAGHPDDPVGDEPDPNGGRINMGAYGGTAQASKSPPPAPPLLDDLGATVHYHRARIACELTNETTVAAHLYLCYGQSGVPGETTNGWDVVAYAGEDSAASLWTPALDTETLHYYRWYAVNNDGSNFTAVAEFTTGTFPPGGGADVIHVDRNATGAGDGADWAHAYTKIADAITAIVGSRTNVWITDGRYVEGAALTLSASATVIGGFVGTEMAVSQRAATNALGVVTNYTVLDGNNAYRCLNITATGTVLLDTMVFSNANTRAVSKTGTGTLIARNCRFTGNAAAAISGVGAYLSGGTVWLEDCRIENNSGTDNGVGVHFSGSTVTMTNCLVAGNIHGALGDAHSKLGIGIYADNGCTLHIVDCVIRDQQGAGSASRHGQGGGLAFDNGTLLVVRTEFTGNRKTGHLSGGYPVGGGAAVFLGNSATMSAVFSNCIFRANEVTQGQSGLDGGRGGAIQANLNAARTATFVNCTFAFNNNSISTPQGGAIYLHSGTLNLRNCILWTNLVTGAGGTGHELYVADGATMNVTHSLLTGTGAPHAVAAGGASINLGDGILTDDPLFASATNVHLQSRGGRWNPQTEAWTSDSLTSPAIDAGDPTDPVGDEPEPNGRRINMGAYGGTWQASKSLMRGTLFLFR